MLSWKTTFLSAVSLCLAMSCTSSLFAEEPSKNITVGTGIAYPPLEFKDPESGELSGFIHDLMEEMAKKADLKITWFEDSWASQASFAPLKTGRVDVGTGNIWDIPDRQGMGVSFLDYLYDLNFFYTSAANAGQFENLNALCGKRVANLRASGPMEEMVNQWSDENCTKSGKPSIEQILVSGNSDSQLMIKQGRVEAGFISATAFVQNTNTSGADAYKRLGGSIGKKFLYGFPYLTENKALGDALRNALDEVIADGTYARLLKKWGLPEDAAIGPKALVNAGK